MTTDIIIAPPILTDRQTERVAEAVGIWLDTRLASDDRYLKLLCSGNPDHITQMLKTDILYSDLIKRLLQDGKSPLPIPPAIRGGKVDYDATEGRIGGLREHLRSWS